MQRLEGETQKEYWERWAPPDDLKECIKLLFEILDAKESSDMGGPDFHPTHISSCRVWDTHRLNKLLPYLRDLVHDPYKHYYGYNKPID